MSDSATAAYKLQNLLPNYTVENKGVPGYGVTQMYLALRESLINKDTPVIAIFNYAWFHEDRTPLHRGWMTSFYEILSKSKQYKN